MHIGTAARRYSSSSLMNGDSSQRLKLIQNESSGSLVCTMVDPSGSVSTHSMLSPSAARRRPPLPLPGETPWRPRLFLDGTQCDVDAPFRFAALLHEQARLREGMSRVAAIAQVSAFVDFPKCSPACGTGEPGKAAELGERAHVAPHLCELDLGLDRFGHVPRRHALHGFGRVGRLCDHDPAFTLDGAQAERSVAAGARHHDADRVLVLCRGRNGRSSGADHATPRATTATALPRRASGRGWAE